MNNAVKLAFRVSSPAALARKYNEIKALCGSPSSYKVDDPILVTWAENLIRQHGGVVVLAFTMPLTTRTPRIAVTIWGGNQYEHVPVVKYKKIVHILKQMS